MKLTLQQFFTVLNVGHCQGDPFKIQPNSLQKASSTAID